MANKNTSYKVTNQGQQVIKAPNSQPKSTGTKVIRGSDLRSGK